MTYRELIRKADRLLETGEITIGEYEGMLAPLDNEVEPKTGKWIQGKYRMTCDQCRCTYDNSLGKTNFCPNCGARMLGEDSEA